MKKLTNEEMMKKIEELETANKTLVENQNTTVKDKVLKLIESGINCIEDISAQLEISSKNVSSNLTAIRSSLKDYGQTIISQRIEKKTMLAIVDLKDLNWQLFEV